MRGFFAREFHLAGMKLNVAAAVLAGLIVSNAAEFKAAVTSLVPAQYQTVAGFVASAVTYLLVRAVARHDAAKAGQ